MSRCKAVLLSFIAIIILSVSQTIAQIAGDFLAKLCVSEIIGNLAASVLYFLLTFLLIKLVVEKFFGFKCADFRISAFRLNPVWIIAGLLLPVAVSAFYLLFVPGKLSFTDFIPYKLFIVLSNGMCFAGFSVGFVEEMVFRGVIFNSVEKAWNTKAAVIVPSVFFGAVHILGMDFSLLSCLLVITAGTAVGIMFSLIAAESGAVWSGGFVHALWNTVIIGGFLNISHDPDFRSLASYKLSSDSFLITGGEFGIESSVIAVAGYVVVAAIAFAMLKKKKQDF